MGHSYGSFMEGFNSMKNSFKVLVAVGAISAISLWAQPTPAPAAGDAPCAAEPTGAAANDTVVAVPDDSGFINMFDGTSFKGWWQSCQTGHSNGSTQGAIFRVDPTLHAIYSTQRNGNIGGILMTAKKMTNYEIVFDLWPDFKNDGGLFNRTPPNGNCFQTVLDYIDGAAMGGTWGEGGFTARDYRPFSFHGAEDQITIPGNDKGEPSNWTTITSKLNPTSFGCPATGCTQTEWQKLWDMNGWNQIRIKFYGGSAANTGNLHMKAYFRKVGATAWVPLSQDTTLNQIVPPNHIGLQVHGGGRFGGANGTWYKNIMYRELTDKGEPKYPTSTYAPKASEAPFTIIATSSALIGKLDTDHEITVKDMNGRTLETFSGHAGKFNYAFTNNVHGWLSLRVKTAAGIESMRVLRAQ